MAIIERITEVRSVPDIPNFFEWDALSKAGTGEQTWEDKILNSGIPGFSFDYNLSEDGLSQTVNFSYDSFNVMNQFKQYINISKLNCDATAYYTENFVLPSINILNAPVPFTTTTSILVENIDPDSFLHLSYSETTEIVVEQNSITLTHLWNSDEEYEQFIADLTLADLIIVSLNGSRTIVHAVV